MNKFAYGIVFLGVLAVILFYTTQQPDYNGWVLGLLIFVDFLCFVEFLNEKS